ncbi:hypothetical protein BaRGS_00002863 [Batillaria attramentaria]|uniref:Uncharacterized protein n=1 Tax=Batillaria attramentaria TaxID=370345 RepID=A0ABD0M305_9CAEN
MLLSYLKMADESDIWEELENSVYIHLASTLSGEVVPPSDDDSDEKEPLSALRKKIPDSRAVI